jgi:hypothetical protein
MHYFENYSYQLVALIEALHANQYMHHDRAMVFVENYAPKMVQIHDRIFRRRPGQIWKKSKYFICKSWKNKYFIQKPVASLLFSNVHNCAGHGYQFGRFDNSRCNIITLIFGWILTSRRIIYLIVILQQILFDDAVKFASFYMNYINFNQASY